MIRVTISEEGKTPIELDFDKSELTIGRGSECDIVLPSNRVSKRHATVHVNGRSITITDADSTNGTHVNGERISAPQPLSGKDHVRISRFEMSFTRIASPDPTAVIEGVKSPSTEAKPSAPNGPAVDINPKYRWR